MKPIKKVAFLGLGVIGYPMAGHLQRAGFDVCVYNRTQAKAEQWQQEYGGRFAATPREAAQEADAVLTCVGNDNDVRSVIFGDQGALAGMSQGAILIDHTTTSADLARELDQAVKEKGVSFIDAPVSGGQAGAENAKLTFMCGGEPTDFERAIPLFEAMGQRWRRIGPAGSGQLCKMVNQICIAGLLQGLAEGIRFGQEAGLSIPDVVDVLGGGAAQSWQLDNRALTMAEDKFDFGFAIDWMRKDLDYALAEANRLGLELPVTSQVNGFYKELQDQGMNRCDTSVLIRRLKAKRETGDA